MSCSCKSDIEAGLAQRFNVREPTATDVKATLKGFGLVIEGNGVQSIGYLDVDITCTVPKRDGGSRSVKKRQAMYFSFCPFCGVRVR